MRLDIEFVKDNFKDIQKTCLLSDLPVPSLLNSLNVPQECKLSFDEINGISFDIQKIRDYKLQLCKIEDKIINGEDDDYDDLVTYWIDELNFFISKNPQYKGIFIYD